MDNKRYAVLDVGSNSVRLLVAEAAQGQVFCVYKDKITTRLLAGMKQRLLALESIERTQRAIEVLADKARALGVDTVSGFGTSAMRDGRNRDELIARARAAGVALRVLEGDEEADLAYAGAAPDGRCGVIDIGGGSTELLAGQDGRRLRAYSAQVGAVRLYEALAGEIDPPRLLALAREALLPAWETVSPCPVDRWVGVGGTVTSLCAITLRLEPYDPEKVQDYPLSRALAIQWFEALCAMRLSQRQQLPGLNPQRADIIPFGAAILCAFFELSGVERLLASDRDNLLGFVEKYLLKGVDNSSHTC